MRPPHESSKRAQRQTSPVRAFLRVRRSARWSIHGSPIRRPPLFPAAASAGAACATCLRVLVPLLITPCGMRGCGNRFPGLQIPIAIRMGASQNLDTPMNNKSKSLQIRSRHFLAACCALVIAQFGSAGKLHASVLYESGLFGGTYIGGGTSVNSDQFLGWRFTLPVASTITEFGATLYLNGGSGTLFGAIAEVDSLADFPDTPNTFAALVSAILSPPVGYVPGSLTSASVSVFLPSGTYAVIFGGGRFGAGATQTGGIANIGSAPYMLNSMLLGHTATDTWGSWTNGNYYFVRAEPVPEPSGAALLLIGLAACGGVRRKRAV